jgi:hypothetical protein
LATAVVIQPTGVLLGRELRGSSGLADTAILGDWILRQLPFGIERGHMKLIGSLPGRHHDPVLNELDYRADDRAALAATATASATATTAITPP